MKNLHILLLLLFTNTIVCAQNRSNWSQSRGGTSSFQQPNMTVKGRLIDLETSDNLSFATISIETVDSILISGGITDDNGHLIISDYDVNSNQLPRGGVIVSLGSTPGLGFAPLAGAKIRPVVSSGGTITSIVGVATTGSSLGIITAFYNNTTGLLTVTTQTDPDWVFGEQSQDEVQLNSLPFSGGLSIGGTFSVVSVAATNTFGVNIGVRETTHNYQGGGEALPWYGDLTFGSGYNGINGIGVTVVDLGYKHRFLYATSGAITVAGGGSDPLLTPTNAIYNPVSVSYTHLTLPTNREV